MSDWSDLRYVVVDVEGSGGIPPELVEVGWVPIVGGAIGEPASFLVRPPQPITPMATRIHGISNADVADAPTAAEIADQVLAAIDGAALVAHAAHIDLDVLRRTYGRLGYTDVFDTLKLARRLLPGQVNHRLGTLAGALDLAAGLSDGLVPHRVTWDVLVTARLFVHMAGLVSLDELRGEPREDTDGAPALF